MDINIILVIVQLITVIATLISAFLLYQTIKSNNILNQNNIFNEVVKQERKLRIKLEEYRKEIAKRRKNKDNFED